VKKEKETETPPPPLPLLLLHVYNQVLLHGVTQEMEENRMKVAK
jgi:hypothetical protein